MILSVEYQPVSEELDIVGDVAGIDSLIEQLKRLKRDGGHIHLMTASWAGAELTEEQQVPNSTLINHVRVVLLPPRG